MALTISLEDLNNEGVEVLDTTAAEGTVEVGEVIEGGEIQDELNEGVNEITVVDASMEEFEDAGLELVENIESQEAALENPAEITPEQAVVAQENLKAIIRRVGGVSMAKAASAKSVSHESIRKSPVTSLQVSTEGAKEFLNKIVDGMKVFWEKIKMWFKKIYIKAVGLTGVSKKNAEALKQKLKAKTAKTVTLEDKDVEAIVNQLGAFVFASNADLKTKLTDIINNYLSFANDKDDAAEGKGLGKVKDAVELSNTLEKIFEPETKFGLSFSNVAENFELPKGKTMAQGKFVSFDGTKVKVGHVLTSTSDSSAGAGGASKTVNMKIETVNIPVKSKIITAAISAGVSEVTKDDVDGVIANLIKSSSGSAAYIKAIEESSKAIEDAFERSEKSKADGEEVSSEDKRQLLLEAKLFRSYIVSVSLDKVLGHIRANKAVLSVCNRLVNKFDDKAADKKDKK